MGEISKDYINPFLMAATGIMKDACQVDLNIGKPYVKTNEFSKESAIIMIGLTGQLKGQVLLAFTMQSALDAASKMMMGMPVTALDDIGVIVDITPPSLAIGTVNIVTTYAQNICVPLEGGGIKMEINVAIKQ